MSEAALDPASDPALDLAPSSNVESDEGPGEVRRSASLVFVAVLSLLALGLVMVFSASAVESAQSGGSPWKPLRAHGFKVLFGLLLMGLAARVDLVVLKRLVKPIWWGTLLLLALVLFPPIGIERNGSNRWLNTASFIGFALQPSELAKLALILCLAAFFADTPDVGKSFWKTFLKGALIAVTPAGLILLETDFGTFGLVMVLGLALLLLAGARLRQLLFLALLLLPVAGAVLWLKPDTRYILDRVTSFVSHHFDGADGAAVSAAGPQQVEIAESALRVGGLTGVGLGAGRHKLFFLAEAENDFILSVIGEELGFIGTTLVLFLFALLLFSGRRVLLGVRHRFGFFLVAGVLLTIAMQALFNIAVTVRWAPVKGIPLPFVSAGGSSLTVLCLGIGLVFAVARHARDTSVELGPDLPHQSRTSPSWRA